MRVGNKGARPSRRKREVRIKRELTRLRSGKAGHGWAARRARKIVNRRKRAPQSGLYA